MPIIFLYMAGEYLSVFVRPCASRLLIERLLVRVLVRERCGGVAGCQACRCGQIKTMGERWERDLPEAKRE